MGLGRPFLVEEIPKDRRSATACQMIELVNGLRQRGIIHGDIKPRNMVWDQNGVLKLVNFASALLADGSDEKEWTGRASVEYMAPKRPREGIPPPTLDDDKYALAVSIWSVFSGRLPAVGLFDKNGGEMPDLNLITDDRLFEFVLDILETGGFDVEEVLPLGCDDSEPDSPRYSVATGPVLERNARGRPPPPNSTCLPAASPALPNPGKTTASVDLRFVRLASKQQYGENS